MHKNFKNTLIRIANRENMAHLIPPPLGNATDLCHISVIILKYNRDYIHIEKPETKYKLF